MAQGDDILGQADALMHRHRSFVARNAAAAAPAETPAKEADIPLLTEIVAPAADTDGGTGPLLPAQALEKEFDDWLAEVLPARIEAFAAQAGKQLLADLEQEARHTLLPRLLAALATRREKEPPHPSV